MRADELLPLLSLMMGVAACEGTAGPGGGTAVVTDGGLYDLTLTADPDPPVAGVASLGIDVADAATGAAVTDAEIGVTPWMTEHGHGLSEDPVVTELGQGAYEASFTYTMSGTWDLTVSIDAEAGADEVTVAYEVE